MTILRRLLLNTTIDISKIENTRKIVYEGDNKISVVLPKDSDNVILAHNYNPSTKKGVIVCAKDITSIDSIQAYSCSKLTIPANVENFGSQCLLSSNIDTLVVESPYFLNKDYTLTVNTYGSQSINNNYIKNANIKTLVIKDVSVNKRLPIVGKFALGLLSNIDEVVFEGYIYGTISNSAFYNSRIKKITFNILDLRPALRFGDLILEYRAFWGTSATEINLPYTTQNIGDECFGNSKDLSILSFANHDAIPTISEGIFALSNENCKIIVPDNLYDEWIVAENWQAFANRIIKKSDWDSLQTTE